MGLFSSIKNFFCDMFGVETKQEKRAKEDLPKEQKPTPEEEKKKKEIKWNDVNDPFKFVIMGGKVQCTFCSNPLADLIVTANNISMQDNLWATIEDSDDKINFSFTGVCTHPSQQKPMSPPPPCKAVISLGQWKDYSETMVNNDNALLMKSKIPCMISNQDLIITDCGQKTSLSKVEPKMNKEPKVTKLYWMDEKEKEIIETLAPGQKAVLFVETVEFNPKDPITIPLEDSETGEIHELKGILNGLGKTKIPWGGERERGGPSPSNEYYYEDDDSVNNETNTSLDRPGYYYQKDGTFLGKIANSENVYITDKATFDKTSKKESVENSKVIAFTEKYKLNNKEILDRANWTYGEGGGYIVERYAMTIENLKKSGRSGYGPTPFESEEDMYKKTMLHGTPPKCLYPGYFDGTYGAQVVKNGKIIQYENGAHRFATARKSTNYSDLNSDSKKKASIKAVLDSLLGNLTNEGYNNWRGSGDKLYTATEKDDYIKNFKQPKDQDLYTAGKTKKVYARVKTTIVHYWEPVNSKFRRHSFYTIKREMVK